MEALHLKANIEKTDKGLRAVASNETLDRQGEVVDLAGWDLKNYKKNPVLLWAHNNEIPAIGIAKNIRIEGEGKKAALTFEPDFHDATDFAKALKYLVEEKGVINSFSVGFMPKEYEGNRITQSELLEISLVNVPANPDARMLAMKSLKDEGFGDDTLKALGLPQTTEEDTIRSEMAVLKAKNIELQEQLDYVVKGLKNLNPRVDKQETAVIRVTLAKVISRATDNALQAKPQQKELATLRVIKRASDRLSHDLKRDLQANGTNQRTS